MLSVCFFWNATEKTNFVFGEFFFTFFTTLFTKFMELMLLVISFVPTWIMMRSGLSATKFLFNLIFFKGSTGKIFNVYLITSWEPLFTYSIKNEVTRCNNFHLCNSQYSHWDDCSSLFFFLNFDCVGIRKVNEILFASLEGENPINYQKREKRMVKW